MSEGVKLPLLEVLNVCKTFPRGSGEPLVVLDDVQLTLRTGEIVCLLGRSGSGKSTLLRIISGLIQPTRGEARFQGRVIAGPSADMAMVFQSFALFPWLTVLENAELGLVAMEVPREESKKRALAAIEMIGLAGFESAYPRELSGGMRQRVGFARALVTQPKLLLMDEPFSALDVLTAETLRTDFLDLWVEGRMPIQSVLLVTHNIEEAVLMCDRILLFSSNPGRILDEVRVPLPHPRNRLDPTFRKIVDSVYARMTARHTDAGAPRGGLFPGLGLGMVLPNVSTNLLSGLLENLAQEPYKGRGHLPALATTLQMEAKALLPIAEVLQLLRFVEVSEGGITLTEAGRRFTSMGPDRRQELFGDHLITYVPLAAHIRRVLDERFERGAPLSRFREELEDYMTPDDAEATLKAVIAWGRYGEIFSYWEDAAALRMAVPMGPA